MQPTKLSRLCCPTLAMERLGINSLRGEESVLPYTDPAETNNNHGSQGSFSDAVGLDQETGNTSKDLQIHLHNASEMHFDKKLDKQKYKNTFDMI